MCQCLNALKTCIPSYNFGLSKDQFQSQCSDLYFLTGSKTVPDADESDGTVEAAFPNFDELLSSNNFNSSIESGCRFQRYV